MKIPFDEAATLQAITKEEDSKLAWIEKKLHYRPYTLLSTTAIAPNYRKPLNTLPQDLVFRPFKFKYIFFLLAALAFAGVMVPVELSPSLNVQHGFLSKAAILFGIVAFAGILIDINRDFEITLSPIGININNTRFNWNEVNKVYILTRKEGKNSTCFLILALGNGEIKKLNCTSVLAGFGSTRKKISAYIEYYMQGGVPVS